MVKKSFSFAVPLEGYQRFTFAKDTIVLGSFIFQLKM